ncbi:MAG: tRNA1(Val) (adenine(37)-N6)-methyltransferase [Bacteroidia bacterium]
MPHQTFVFKQFNIQQDKCAMKIGTDAVLIGAWVDAKEAGTILDVGTGTGIIAIMLAQKSKAQIDAVDVELSAYEQATENVRFCKWNEKIRVHHSSFQDFSTKSRNKYDLIVSNPPYFVHSSKAAGEERSHARHNDLLSFEELVNGVVKALKKDGRFCVILPKQEASMLRTIAEKHGLQLSKLLRVRTKADKETEKRHLMQFEFTPHSFSESTIVIEKDGRHEYTDEYKELTKDYYISF